ncbi:MAG: type II toxin-antitoxin system VapC family toxin [Chloroflexota bacterium]
MSLDITKFSDSEIYVDTMIFYLFLRGTDPNVKKFFQQIRAQKFTAYTSVLTFDELSYKMLLASIRDKYPGSPLNYMRNDEVKMIAEFYPTLRPMIERLQNTSALTLVDVNANDVMLMHENITKYHLKPRDALHLTAMQKTQCMNILTNDSDFDNIASVQRYTI